MFPSAMEVDIMLGSGVDNCGPHHAMMNATDLVSARTDKFKQSTDETLALNKLEFVVRDTSYIP